MNYQHLKYFQVIVREKNFKRASEKLFVTQPALSRAINNLEEELGVKLLKTSKTGTEITACGEEFIKYVDRALESIDEGIYRMQEMSGDLKGTLRIASVYGYVYEYIPVLVDSFNRVHPQIHLKISLGSTWDTLEKISKEQADVGFYISSPHSAKFHNIQETIVSHEKLVVIVPATWNEAGRTSIRLADLEGEPVISFGKNSGILYSTEKAFFQAGLEYNPYLVADNDATILNLVRSGMGAATVLRNIVPQNDPSICMLKIEDDVDIVCDICMGINKDKKPSVVMKKFTDHVCNILKA